MTANDFRYVDSAIGRADKRNRVIPLETFKAPLGAKDCYTTYLRFPEDFITYWQTNRNTNGKPSVSGYPGLALAIFIPFDFDSEEDPSKALMDTRRVVQHWMARYGVPAKAIRVYFSGCKGFSVELPASLFGGFEPSEVVADRLKYLAVQLAPETETLDLGIYEKMRLWRVPNTINAKSGLYKVPLTVEELLTLDIVAIKKLAESPRHIDVLSEDALEAMPELRALWAATSKPSVASAAGPSVEGTAKIRLHSRNRTLASMAGTMRKRGMGETAIRAALLATNAEQCEPPLEEAEVRRIAASIGQYPPGEDGNDAAAHAVILAPASSFRPEPVRSAWEGRVPLGMVTLLVGVPGKGKSTLTVDLVARASRGELPGDLFGHPVTVALATAEDAISQVVVPRLIAAGADLDRVKIIQVKHQESIGGLSLPDDIDKLREQLMMAEARIVVVDPLVAHIGGSVNTWKDQDVRRVLAPLAHLAEAADAAVIGVMHLNKNQTSDVLNKVGGSVGFGAAARSVLFFAPDPEDPDPESYKRILAHAKCNVGPLAPALRFRVEGREVQGHVGVTIKTSAIAWCGEARGVAAADLVVEPATAEERQAKTAKEQEIEEAVEVIRQLIAGGTTEADAVQNELKGLRIRERVWREAKCRLGVTSKKSSFKAGWEWVLPEGGQRLPYKPESVAFVERRESQPAKYPNNAEDDEDDEGRQSREDAQAVCTPSKATKTDEGDEEVEDGGEHPSPNGLDHDEAYWQKHDGKVVELIRASARSGGAR